MHLALCSFLDWQGPECSAFWAGTDQKDSYAPFPGKAVIACDNAPRAVFSSLVCRPRVLGILAGMDQKDSCPRRTGCWFFWEMTSVGFCFQRSAWFDSGYIRCVSLRGFWKNFGVVQTVQKTVKVPHCSWTWLLTSAGWLRQCRYCGVSAVGVALLCLCQPPSHQRQWFLRGHGLRAILATVTLLHRASLCRVSGGVWRKVSSPEVLRLFFCERRMRCGFVWCSSHSTQWTGQVPGTCFLDKDVDVPVLATSWSCRAHHGYGELFRAVCTVTRPGLTPAIRAGKGWRGRRELAPRCSATQLAACRHDPGQTRRVLNVSYHTHHQHHPPLHPHTHTPPHSTRLPLPSTPTHTHHHHQGSNRLHAFVGDENVSERHGWCTRRWCRDEAATATAPLMGQT